MPVTLSNMMGKVLMDEPLLPGEGILHHLEGVDLIPTDIQLSGMEVSLVNAMSRERILRQYLDSVRNPYSHILIDRKPSLEMITVNALAAANRVFGIGYDTENTGTGNMILRKGAGQKKALLFLCRFLW